MSLRTSFFLFVFVIVCVVGVCVLRPDVSGDPVTECRPVSERECEKSKQRPCQPSVCPNAETRSKPPENKA
ncbi:MAG: hypothetical protein OXN25_17790 [Candidatus Poribacteria bacterium]|nr:hypothetical protein [Candidatus Poribacteria bacterium]